MSLWTIESLRTGWEKIHRKKALRDDGTFDNEYVRYLEIQHIDSYNIQYNLQEYMKHGPADSSDLKENHI